MLSTLVGVIILMLHPHLHAQVGLSVTPPRIYYTLGAGESTSHRVLVNNLSKQSTLNLSVTFGDWKYDERGDNLMLPPDSLDNSCAGWLSLPGGTYFSLAPGESREMDVTMSVPASTTDSSNVQTAMLYVTQLNPMDGVDAKGAAIRISLRQAIKIYRKGLLPEIKKLEIVDMQFDRKNNTLGLEFINSGTIWVNGTLVATLFNRTTGREITLAETVFYTMPGDHRKMYIGITEELDMGDYIATLLIDYGDENTLEAAELDFSIE